MGYTNAVLGDLDQKKVNVIYEVTKNSLTGNTGLKLSLRPGVTDSITYGDATQSSFLYNGFLDSTGFGDPFSVPVVFSILNTSTRASTSSATTSFHIQANAYPKYVDHVLVNGVDNPVVQIANQANPTALQTVYYSSTFPFFSQIELM